MAVVDGTTFQFMWARWGSISSEFRAGVSLHSHTMYSEESLEAISRYTSKVPFVDRAIRLKGAEFGEAGDRLEFRNAFWTPPLSSSQACRLEERQIKT
ncbi:MAG: hypothetical protein ACR2JB_28415 [Bryobacteraceae bacterium]